MMQPTPVPRDILIVGAGIAGLASAISLAKELASSIPDLKISVFEGAPGLSASGGAISLTPTAQNYLDKLGVLSELNRMGSEAGIEVDLIELFSLRSGRRLGPLKFTDENGFGYGGYKGRRVMRNALSRAMLSVIQNHLPSVSVYFNKKVVGGTTTDSSVTLSFEDGSFATGDLVLGCDGVHSITRTRIVDPGNRSEYTGISFIQSVSDAHDLPVPMHFNQTAIHLTRHSSLLTSYCDPDRQKIFSAAILRVNEHLIERYQATSKSDCPEQASMKMSIRYLVRTQFAKSALPSIRALLDHTEDWALYPVYQVRQRGKWHKGRILLLGDAAHAVSHNLTPILYFLKQILIIEYRCLPATNPPHTPSKTPSSSHKFSPATCTPLSPPPFKNTSPCAASSSTKSLTPPAVSGKVISTRDCFRAMYANSCRRCTCRREVVSRRQRQR